MATFSTFVMRNTISHRLILGPKADLNLGIKTFLNGTLVSDIVIDTTQVATDTIDYVATSPYRPRLDQHPNRAR